MTLTCARGSSLQRSSRMPTASTVKAGACCSFLFCKNMVWAAPVTREVRTECKFIFLSLKIWSLNLSASTKWLAAVGAAPLSRRWFIYRYTVSSVWSKQVPLSVVATQLAQRQSDEERFKSVPVALLDKASESTCKTSVPVSRLPTQFSIDSPIPVACKSKLTKTLKRFKARDRSSSSWML